MSTLWGIDLGGTKVEGVILDTTTHEQNGLPTTVCRKRIPSNADQGYEAIIQSIKDLCQLLVDESGMQMTRVGIGTPGVTDPQTGNMKNCNSTALNGQPLKKDLEAALQLEVTLANDANCFALAEHRYGAAKGASTSFGVIMGTGVGGGLIVHDQLVLGHQAIGGEWGHINALVDGEACYCGSAGCVETIISGPALERFYSGKSSQELSLPEIAELATQGDSVANETIERLCFHFGRCLASVINIVDPEVIVLGGGVSNIDALYDKGKEVLDKYVFNTSNHTQLLKNTLGDSAGVFGAALL